MEQHVRHRHLRWTLPIALCVASMVGSTQATIPQGRPDEPAFDEPRRATDVALPPQAKPGTGLVGKLGPTALDAVSLTFTLPDSRVLRARRQQAIDDRGRDYKAWVGTFEDQPGSLVVLGTYRGATTGFLSYGPELWEILPTADGKLVLYRFDDSRLPVSEPTLMARKSPAAMSPPIDYGTSTPTAQMLEAGYVQDLLVAYTPASRRRYGQATLESMIHNAVQAANQAYRNSGVAISLDLVGLQEVAYDENGGDMKSSLRDVQGRGDGRLDEVHVLRDRLGADIVSLITEDSDSCGIAWSMRGETPGGASTAFNVVNAGCLSNQSLAHEIGHNQGNMHDRDSTTNTGSFAYSFGYRRCAEDGSGFRTVMAYACKGVARVARFSSPAMTYQGQPMGVAYETDPDNSADNVRSMNTTADTVAAFRSARGMRPVRMPVSVSAWTSAPGTVVLHWFDTSAEETGYKVERSSNGIDFLQVATLGANATRFVDNDAADATRYYYRVRAFNGRGNGPFSETRDVAMW